MSVYTSFSQTEQPVTIRDVTALTVVGDGLLTIECDVAEQGHTFSAHHRYEAGQWTHLSVQHNGSSEPDR